MMNKQLADGKRSANWTKTTQKRPVFGINENRCYLPTGRGSANWTIFNHRVFNKINDLRQNSSWQTNHVFSWQTASANWLKPTNHGPCRDFSRWLRSPHPLQG